MNKNSFTSNIKSYKNDRTEKPINMQPNCIASSSSVPIIYTGCEDGSLKSIDLRSGKNCLIMLEYISNSVMAHTDAVTSINMFNDIYLFTTSHDTKIRLWDIRNLTAPQQENIVKHSFNTFRVHKRNGMKPCGILCSFQINLF
jgi:WD40 repeat protein